MKKLYISIVSILISHLISAQNIGINTTTPDSSAAMEVYATDKGFLMPRLSTAQMNAVSKPAAGLAVYNTDSSSICVYTGSTWLKIILSNSLSNYFTASDDNIYSNNSGNVGIGTSSPSYKLHVSGTAKADSINTTYLKISNGAASGYVLQSDSSGNAGWADVSNMGALRYIGTSYLGKTSGYGSTGTSEGVKSKLFNIYIGDYAGNSNDSGVSNIGIGYKALYSNTYGGINTAIGDNSMISNTTGSYNVACGGWSLLNNTTGNYNTSIGFAANHRNTTGSNNTSLGYAAGIFNTSGLNNTCIGYAAGGHNVTGSGNVYLGYQAGYNYLGGTTNGSGNVYLGNQSGYYNTGSSSVFLGYQAGYYETGSNKLYISNSSTTSPLVYGDFSSKSLVINDNLQSKYFKLTNGAASGYVLQSDSSGNASWVSSTTLSSGNWTTSGVNQYSALSGNVGIGTSSPSYKLQVSGTAKADSINTSYFKMSNGASKGYILQSDSSGNASWVSSTTLSSGNWTTSGANQYSALSGNVGIGTSSPSYKLQVSGTAKADSINTSYFKMSNGASKGYILQSDSSGNAGWGDAANTGALRYAGTSYLGKTSGYGGTGTSEGTSSNLYNILIGDNTGKLNTSGSNNIALGANSLLYNTTGSYNNAFGTGALLNNVTGIANNAYGYSALLHNTTGSFNIAYGGSALFNLTSGSNNTSLGYASGLGNLTGSGNVFIGYQAGFNETGSNKLYISNSITSSPLIYGDFSNKKIAVNDSLQSKYFTLTNGAANGYVLQSDSSGNASWVSSTTLSSGNWTTSGADQYSALSGNVGIGTSSPSYKLQVSGTAKADSINTSYFKMSNGAANGYVLQSDSSGNAGWVSSSSALGTSSLTSGYIPVWKGSSFNNSPIYNKGSIISVGSTTTNFGGVFQSPHVSIVSNSSDSGDINIITASNTIYSPFINIGKARGSSSSLSSVKDGDGVMVMTFNAYDGSSFNECGLMSAYVDGTPSKGKVPLHMSFVTTNTSGSTNERISIGNTGYVGIGISSPSYKLQVSGTAKADSINTSYFKMTNGASKGYILQSDSSGNASWVSSTSLNTSNWTTSGTNQYSSLSGNVGIGTSSPSYKLQVSGTAKADSINTSYFKMTNGASKGYILQSDSSGNASWVSSTSLTNSNWTTSGKNQYSSLSGNVGIGTSSPSSKLDIQDSSNVTASVRSTSNSGYYSISTPSGKEGTLNLKTYSNGSEYARWAMGKDIVTESGSNKGGNFFINRYDDNGNYAGQPLFISRANGTVTIGYLDASSTENTLKVNGSMAVKVSVITSSNNSTSLNGNDYMVIYRGTAISGNSISLPDAGSYTGRIYMIVNHSNSSVSISKYYTGNSSSSTSISSDSEVQLVSDGTYWHRIN